MAMTGKVCMAYLLSILFIPELLLAGIMTGELDKTEGSIDDTFIYTLTK